MTHPCVLSKLPQQFERLRRSCLRQVEGSKFRKLQRRLESVESTLKLSPVSQAPDLDMRLELVQEKEVRFFLPQVDLTENHPYLVHGILEYCLVLVVELSIISVTW